ASPGYCWPFQGLWSEVLIWLPTQIELTAITIQHTSKIAFLLGTVISLLWHECFLMVVLSLSCSLCSISKGVDEEGADKTLLRTFIYALQKDPIQTFPLQNGIPRTIWFSKSVIQRNCRKPGYICIYQVQVYGKIVGANAIGQAHM
ncbi:SUN5 protein, partial [Anhinga anhinga]|nr:SUN5 protein [Anhinga anhinga]